MFASCLTLMHCLYFFCISFAFQVALATVELKTDPPLKNVSQIKDVNCFSNNGELYRGTVNTTKNKRDCVYWDDARLPIDTAERRDLNKWLAEKDGSTSHNWCRNPSGRFSRPWCFTNSSFISRSIASIEYCDVPSCQQDTTASGLVWSLIDELISNLERNIKQQPENSSVQSYTTIPSNTDSPKIDTGDDPSRIASLSPSLTLLRYSESSEMTEMNTTTEKSLTHPNPLDLLNFQLFSKTTKPPVKKTTTAFRRSSMAEIRRLSTMAKTTSRPFTRTRTSANRSIFSITTLKTVELEASARISKVPTNELDVTTHLPSTRVQELPSSRTTGSAEGSEGSAAEVPTVSSAEMLKSFTTTRVSNNSSASILGKHSTKTLEIFPTRISTVFATEATELSPTEPPKIASADVAKNSSTESSKLSLEISTGSEHSTRSTEPMKSASVSSIAWQTSTDFTSTLVLKGSTALTDNAVNNGTVSTVKSTVKSKTTGMLPSSTIQTYSMLSSETPPAKISSTSPSRSLPTELTSKLPFESSSVEITLLSSSKSSSTEEISTPSSKASSTKVASKSSSESLPTEATSTSESLSAKITSISPPGSLSTELISTLPSMTNSTEASSISSSQSSPNKEISTSSTESPITEVTSVRTSAGPSTEATLSSIMPSSSENSSTLSPEVPLVMSSESYLPSISSSDASIVSTTGANFMGTSILLTTNTSESTLNTVKVTNPAESSQPRVTSVNSSMAFTLSAELSQSTMASSMAMTPTNTNFTLNLTYISENTSTTTINSTTLFSGATNTTMTSTDDFLTNLTQVFDFENRCSQCVNKLACIPIGQDYYCACEHGWTGKNCDQPTCYEIECDTTGVDNFTCLRQQFQSDSPTVCPLIEGETSCFFKLLKHNGTVRFKLGCENFCDSDSRFETPKLVEETVFCCDKHLCNDDSQLAMGRLFGTAPRLNTWANKIRCLFTAIFISFTSWILTVL